MNVKKMSGLKFALPVIFLSLTVAGCSLQTGRQNEANMQSTNGEKSQEQAVITPPVMLDAMTASNPTLGNILVNGKGMTMYIYTKDAPGKSACYDTCAVNWPPVLATDTPKAASDLSVVDFGTTMRTDGTKQLTYKGQPLYLWIKDKTPGDATGEAVGGVWYVVKTASTAAAK